MRKFFGQFAKLLYHGTQVLIKSIRKSIAEEVRLSEEAAQKLREDREGFRKKSGNDGDLTPDEAMKILDVDQPSRKLIESNFRRLFAANDVARGGSFYLQSKVFRAKQILDRELGGLRNELAEDEKPKTD